MTSTSAIYPSVLVNILYISIIRSRRSEVKCCHYYPIAENEFILTDLLTNQIAQQAAFSLYQQTTSRLIVEAKTGICKGPITYLLKYILHRKRNLTLWEFCVIRKFDNRTTMPHHRHHKVQIHRGPREDSNGNDNVGLAAHEVPLQQEEDRGHGGGNDVQLRHGGGNDDNHEVVQCCVPSGCLYNGESIDPSDPMDSVRVVCNNEHCKEGTWMHKVCFVEWEDVVLAYLKSCGRARSWSEKQRLQNLWTKKGYDLAFKACDCRCGRGHLRKDLDYIPPPKNDNAKKHKKKTKKNDRPMPVVSNSKSGHNTMHLGTNANTGINGNLNQTQMITGILNANANGNTIVNQNADANDGNSTAIINKNQTVGKKENGQKTAMSQGQNYGNINDKNNNISNGGSTSSTSRPINTIGIVRPRTDSLGSTGSSPANSVGSGPTASPPVNGNMQHNVRTAKAKFDPYTDIAAAQAAMANLFKRRHDLSAFNVLPRHKQNPYHIKMEDEGPPGNDEIRAFVLAHLGSYKVTSLNCVLCKSTLPVFDRYPMIDGTFFLSPQAYHDSVVQVVSDGRLQFINAVCVSCLEGTTDVRCKACKRKWDGSTLLLGSMYSYDIFAAMPCCQKRLSCKHCHRAVVDIGSGLHFYSEYSRMIACPYCKAHDYHFIRPMSETFAVKNIICN